MTTSWADLFEGDSSDWVEALPSYQRKIVESMLSSREPIDVATAWLSASGPVNNAPLGAVHRTASLFYDNLLAEIQALICTNKGYVAERKELSTKAEAGKMAFVIAVSDAVAPHVGTTPVLLGPAIAVTFIILARAGKDSICTALAELIEERKKDSQPPSS